jgi:hypothetical protein
MSPRHQPQLVLPGQPGWADRLRAQKRCKNKHSSYQIAVELGLRPLHAQACKDDLDLEVLNRVLGDIVDSLHLCGSGQAVRGRVFVGVQVCALTSSIAGH